jgi:hypothetical protein
MLTALRLLVLVLGTGVVLAEVAAVWQRRAQRRKLRRWLSERRTAFDEKVRPV